LSTRLPNDDEVRGKINEAAGVVKERYGRAKGDPNLETEGADQRASGKVEAGFGRVKRKVSEGLDELGDKINR
jgi:uncharacterized protein YjbJ (UPF0337 family)